MANNCVYNLIKNNLIDLTKTIGYKSNLGNNQLRAKAESKQTTSINNEVEISRKKLEDNILKGTQHLGLGEQLRV